MNRMKLRRPIAIVTSLVLILATPLTWAGDRGHGHRGGHGHGGWNGGHHGYYQYGGGHGGGGYPYAHHRGHHGGGNNEVAYLVGGLLLGGLFTHAYHRSQPVYAPAYVPQASYPYTRTYTVPDAGRRLVRDQAGNCFESTFDASGNEYRTPVSPALCNW